jgi:signal transduction histidine kinase
MMRPLDFIPSIKVKLGLVMVGAVFGTTTILSLGRRAGWSFEVKVGVAVVIGLLVMLVLARGMTSPLREMAAAASAMARGDYGRRVRATSRDEVGALARAFNAMAADLEDAERARRQLVADVSHELRTPLGALQALLENLVDGVEEPEPERLRTALHQTERLGRLVSQLLDVSRWQDGAVPLEPRSFAVRPLLEQVTRECSLDEPAVRLRVCVEPGDLEAVGDPERVHQVLANLLDNAVRHSPRDGRVWLSAHRDDLRTVIAVADEGPGIAPAAAEKVFERFARDENAGGTGLGLAIARWIVDAHGGAIRAERRDPTGCRMVVELPR